MENLSLRLETEKLQKAANMLKAVAHPIRMAVLDLLDQRERLNVSEILEVLKIEQALLSHHLSNMKDKGILVCEREGKNIYYAIADKKIMGVIDCIQSCDKF